MTDVILFQVREMLGKLLRKYNLLVIAQHTENATRKDDLRPAVEVLKRIRPDLVPVIVVLGLNWDKEASFGTE